MRAPSSARFRRWIGAALLFAAYAATAKGGLLMDAVGGFATLVWPPTGIALATLLCWGGDLWPGVTLGAFLVNWSLGASAAAAGAISIGNTLEPLLAFLLLKRVIGFQHSLERIRDVLGLFLAATAAALLGASIGVLSLSIGDAISPGESRAAWAAWWLGDLLGVLIVAPALLTWKNRPRPWTEGRTPEAAAFVLCLAAANGLVFLPHIDTSPRDFLSAYILLVPLFWAALRFGPSGAALAILFTAASAILGTARGHGPFVRESLRQGLFHLQVFLGVKSMITLLLAAAVAERRKVFKELRESLREKETLLREIHHRVKNNLQIVHSLLTLQAARVGDPRTLEGLRDCRERVKTMALVHEKLYQSLDLARINFAAYLDDLAKHLLHAYGERDHAIRLLVEAEPIPLDVREAIPCGLVVYELVSNSLKHAFPGGMEGTIRVGLTRESDGRVTLGVEDDGAGFPQGMDFRGEASLGMRLVSNLVEQLDGTLSLSNGRGTTVRVTFRSTAPESGGKPVHPAGKP